MMKASTLNATGTTHHWARPSFEMKLKQIKLVSKKQPKYYVKENTGTLPYRLPLIYVNYI